MPFSFYLRLTSPRDESFPAAVKALIPEAGELHRKNQPADEWAFVTPAMPEQELKKLLDELLRPGDKLLTRIRILDY